MAPKKASQKKQKNTLVLLDAHAILHRAYHALPDFSSPSGEPTGALYGVVAMLLKIVEELKPTYIAACFDLPEPTYRHEAYSDYKAGRAKTDDALVAQINRSRDIFEAFGIPIYEHPGFEADDMLGTIAEQTKETKDLTVIIASGDMDTLQLVEKERVQVYTLRKGIKDTILYNEKTVKERFGFGPLIIPDYKGLRGDPSDNIPGIAGIGEKTATELLINFGTIEKLYKKLDKSDEPFLKVGIKPRIVKLLKEGKEEAEFSKMLATIRRDAPITYTLPEVTWREKLDCDGILALFSELGFRTLSGRVEALFGAVPEDIEEEMVSEGILTETALKLWILESDTTNPTREDILAYARLKEDRPTVKSAIALIDAELKKQKLEDIYTTIEKPLIPVLTEMHENGIELDSAYLKKLSKKSHTELDGLEAAIYIHAGIEFNINSPKQLGEVLYDTLGLKPKNQKRTATGQRSTKESELEKLIEEHPIIKEILRYRELSKLVSTYIDTLPKMVGEDGRVHTTFLQAGTTTGRMASKDPNLQNIPARTEEGRAIRKAFVAPKGHSLLAIDYSQIELRIAALLSGDPKLTEIFKKGEDVHQGVASRVFGVAPEDVTPNMRRKAKVINFGILYGMGVNALRQNLGDDTTREEAQEFLNAYFNTFTRLAEYLEETKAFARKYGYTETLFGRRRYFAGITSHVQFMRAAAERMAINAPIQGTSADMIRIAMVRIYDAIKSTYTQREVKMLLQVHDELVFEVKNEDLSDVASLMSSLMSDVLTEKERKGIPILVDMKAGQNWEDLETLSL